MMLLLLLSLLTTTGIVHEGFAAGSFDATVKQPLTRVSLQNATAQAANTGSLDLSKLTAVSFAAMRLEIGSWQVVLRPEALLGLY